MLTKFLPLLFEPFAYRLPVYGQYKFAIIGRILLHLEDVVFDFKLSSMFLGINLAITLDSFFPCQKTIYHRDCRFLFLF